MWYVRDERKSKYGGWGGEVRLGFNLVTLPKDSANIS